MWPEYIVACAEQIEMPPQISPEQNLLRCLKLHHPNFIPWDTELDIRNGCSQERQHECYPTCQWWMSGSEYSRVLISSQQIAAIEKISWSGKGKQQGSDPTPLVKGEPWIPTVHTCQAQWGNERASTESGNFSKTPCSFLHSVFTSCSLFTESLTTPVSPYFSC